MSLNPIDNIMKCMQELKQLAHSSLTGECHGIF